MVKTVGLEMHWLPTTIGSLFIKGGMHSLEYWYKAITEKKE
jgi:hypothetical protein